MSKKPSPLSAVDLIYTMILFFQIYILRSCVAWTFQVNHHVILFIGDVQMCEQFYDVLISSDNIYFCMEETILVPNISCPSLFCHICCIFKKTLHFRITQLTQKCKERKQNGPFGWWVSDQTRMQSVTLRLGMASSSCLMESKFVRFSQLWQ